MRCPDELSEGVVDVDGRCDFVLKHVAVVRQDGGHAGADVIALDKRDLPDVEFHLIDTGHFALEDKADEIVPLIRHFLGRRVVPQ